MSSFDIIYGNLMHALDKSDRIRSISKVFSECSCDEKRVELVFNILQENVLPLTIHQRGKSTEESVRLRNVGNSAFKQKKLSAALKLYSQSVAVAPNDSAELALAYANRSAVLFMLKSYELCVVDINRAIACNYPDHLKYKLYERKAKCFLHNGCLEQSKRSFTLALKNLEVSTVKDKTRENLEKSYNSELESCVLKAGGEESTNSKTCFSADVEDAKDPLSCQNSNCLPSVSSPGNAVIPSASRAIKLDYNSEEGRYLCATEDIHPGDVLVVEEPYSSILLPDQYSSHCFECYKRNEALVPCLSCSLVMYCSEKCRNRNWEKCHKIECKILPTLLDLEFNKMELLALRILLVASRQGLEINLLRDYVESFSHQESDVIKGLNSSGQYISSDYCSMHHLETNSHRRSLADLFRRCTVATVFIYLLGRIDFFESELSSKIENGFVGSFEMQPHLSGAELFCGALLMKYLQCLPCNAHEVSEMLFSKCADSHMVYDSLEIGAVAYPVLSLINHSCDPNVVRHSYNGDTVVLRAIQVIHAGDQLYDNYGYHHALHSREERQKHLLEQYYFQCQCLACLEDWPRYGDLASTNPVYLTRDTELLKKVSVSSKVFQSILEKVLEMKTNGHLDFLYKHLALLQQTIQRPWKEFSECQETVKQCLSMEANHYIFENQS
nr:PREDICTED: SET and MYND domain-containing protein 4 [Bemisia tabaci]